MPVSNLSVGEFVQGRYQVAAMLGQGGFGAVYSAIDITDGTIVALKVESATDRDQVLKMERSVLAMLSYSPHFCRLLGKGRNEEYNFLAMTLVGRNLSRLQWDQPGHTYRPGDAIRLSLQCLEALQSLHQIGFIHRDVKPGNFAIGIEGEANMVYLLDFGLVRRYVDIEGNIKVPRDRCHFRGTPTYASIDCHKGYDTGRHDDLWSLLYMTVEFLTGRLLWANMRELREVRDLKLNTSKTQLLKNCPPKLGFIYDYLSTLKYYDTPDYQKITQLYRSMLTDLNVDIADPYGWQVVNTENTFT